MQRSLSGLLRNRWLRGVAAAVILTWLALSFSPGMLSRGRAPNQQEEILYYFVQNIGEPSLCDRISWSAYRSYSVLFGGGGASYWRSDCYEQAAQQRHDADLCWKARPLVDFALISAGYSALSCRRRTLAGNHSGIALPDKVLVRTFEKMGYDIDRMSIEGVVAPAVRLRDVYWSVARTPAAVARAQQCLVSKDAQVAQGDLAYMADLAAVATSDPKWCAYIPIDQALAGQRAPFRDWCYYTLAQNTRDAGICKRMAPASASPAVAEAIARGMRPEIAEQLSLRGQCDRIAPVPGTAPAVRYAAEIPADPGQAQRLIGELDAQMPSAHDWTDNQKAIYLLNFLFALWPSRHDPARDDARAELVRRVQSLAIDDGLSHLEVHSR